MKPVVGFIILLLTHVASTVPEDGDSTAKQTVDTGPQFGIGLDVGIIVIIGIVIVIVIVVALVGTAGSQENRTQASQCDGCVDSCGECLGELCVELCITMCEEGLKELVS